SRLNLLFFEIKNNSLDTIYLSKKNIVIHVLKNYVKLNDEEDRSSALILHKSTEKNKDKIDRENDQEKETALLRHNFAEKMFYKNFAKSKSKQNKDFIIRIIEADCIVLLPNKTINYGRIFNNVAFDNSCEVDISYDYNKIFTFFMTANDKVVNIYN
ncbi:hypothetical protein, partial [Flavobacterium collinsii]|uniref:hypothetical protein n=1 Tax=Flavobacterium collinsii TaxID=1114861 RepID=UPI0015700DA9